MRFWAILGKIFRKSVSIFFSVSFQAKINAWKEICDAPRDFVCPVVCVAAVPHRHAATGELEKERRDKQQGGGGAGSAQLLFDGHLLLPAGIHQPLHLRPVGADDHGAQDQPDLHAAGGLGKKNKTEKFTQTNATPGKKYGQ